MNKYELDRDFVMYQTDIKTNRRLREILEEEIVALYGEYENCKLYEYDAYEHAISEMTDVRRDLFLSEHSIKTDEDKNMVRQFNDNLREALTNLYEETQYVLGQLKDIKGKDVVPHLYIDEEYPSTFSDQSERAKRMWKIILDGNVHIMYSDGYCLGGLKESDSLNRFLYINEEPDNWNFDIVGLFDVEIPNMIMVHAAHDWASHMHLTIFDLMHVRKFKSEITIEINQNYNNEKDM